MVCSEEVLADYDKHTAFDKMRAVVLVHANKLFNGVELRKSYGGMGDYMFAFFEPNPVEAAAKTS